MYSIRVDFTSAYPIGWIEIPVLPGCKTDNILQGFLDSRAPFRVYLSSDKDTQTGALRVVETVERSEGCNRYVLKPVSDVSIEGVGDA